MPEWERVLIENNIMVEKMVSELEFPCVGYLQSKAGEAIENPNGNGVSAFRRTYASGRADVGCPYLRTIKVGTIKQGVVTRTNMCTNGVFSISQGERPKCPYVVIPKSRKLSERDRELFREGLEAGLSGYELEQKYNLSSRQVSIWTNKLK